MSTQFEFDFGFPVQPPEPVEPPEPEVEAEVKVELPPVRPLQRRDLTRAALGWLVNNGAAAVATQVATRVSMFKADAAAFWCEPVRNTAPAGPRKVLIPTQTIAIECRRTRAECWPDCTNSEELAPELKALHKRRDELRRQIRMSEPQLRRSDSLFEEFAEWNYDDTSNMEYHQLKQKIRKLEKALYKGTRFEGIRKLRIADFAYLAVPRGMVQPHELAEGWGLLWVGDQFDIEVVIEAEHLQCYTENRMHLAQNIAISARDAVLFANGIREREDHTDFLQLPRRRRKPYFNSSEEED